MRNGDRTGGLGYHGTDALRGAIVNGTGDQIDLTLPATDTLAFLGGIVLNASDGVASVSSPSADRAYGIGQTIQVNVTFTAPVTVTGSPTLELETGATDRNATYASGSGGRSLLFEYTVLEGDEAADLDYTGTSALSLAGGTIVLSGGAAAGLILPPTGSPGSLAGASDIVVGAPEVASVSSPDAAGAYGAGETIRVNVTFNKPVSAAGSPTLELETGATDRNATYAPGQSGGASLLFEYEVQGGDSSPDLDYTGASALSLNGGAIRGQNGIDAILTLPAQGAGLRTQGAIAVDGVAPRIANVTSPDDDGTYGTGTVVNITVGFTEPVEFDPPSTRPEIPLDTGSGEQRNAVCEPASGFNAALECAYTVRDGDATADLGTAAGASLVLGGAAARDAAGNGLAPATLPASPPGATLGGSKDIALDTSVPAVLRVTSPNGTGPHDAGSEIHIHVEFDGTVTIDPAPNDGGAVPALHLETGENDRTASYAGGSGTDTLVFVYTVIAGDFSPDLDLDYTRTAVLSLGHRSLVDEYGNEETSPGPALPGEGSAGSLGSQGAVEVRTVPTVVRVGANYTDASLRAGDTVGIRVQFSEKVWVVPPSGAGAPHIELDTGRTDRGLAVYSSGSGTHTLAFPYQVHPTDDAAALDYAGAGALKNNSAQVRGAGMLDADLSLPDPAMGGSLASKNIRLLPNEAPSIVQPGNTTVGVGSLLELEITAVDPEGQPVLFSLAGDAPQGAAIGAGTGLFTWRPTEAQRTAQGGNSTYVIAVSASDPHGASDTARFALTVIDPKPSGYGGPSLAAVPPVEGREGEEIRFDIRAADGLGPFTYSLVAGADPPPPPGAIIYPNGTFSWTPGYGQSGAHAITARVLDRFGESGTQAFTVTVADAEPPGNAPPEIEPVDPQSADEGDRLVVNVSAEDEHPPITYSLAGDPPGGAAIDPATGVFTWDIGYDAAGTHNITVSAADRYNRTSSLSFAVEVADRARPDRPPAAAATAADAVFAGPRAVRIDYEVPLGPPAGHEGGVYGTVAIAGGGSAEAASVSGLGTSTHIVRLDGDAAGISQNGTIRLLAGLEGAADGAPYRVAAGDIPVRPGEEARTLSPPGASPAAAIEAGGFVRALNATAAGDSARPAINVSALAAGVNTTLPSDARVAIIASFAAVWLPPNANATGVPADGLIELYVSQRAPDARDIAGAFRVDARDVLEVRRVVEAGDDAARIEFSLPVRILLAGQANGSAFYAGADGTVVPIVAMCGADDMDAVHAQLGGSGACQIDSEAGKVVYTYHLTRFGTAAVDYGDTCSAALSRPEIAFGRIAAGGQSAAAAQEVRGAGTLPLALVSVSADGAWAVPGGAVVMPANATSARAAAGGDWTRLGGGAVDVPADAGGRSASVEFRLDVPQGALEAGARDAMVSQAVTYTVTCAAPPG